MLIRRLGAGPGLTWLNRFREESFERRAPKPVAVKGRRDAKQRERVAVRVRSAPLCGRWETNGLWAASVPARKERPQAGGLRGLRDLKLFPEQLLVARRFDHLGRSGRGQGGLQLPAAVSLPRRSWLAEHRDDGGRRSDLDFAEGFEAVALIEREVERIARLQIGRQLVGIAASERVSHELVA